MVSSLLDEPTSIDISATSGIEFLSAAVIKCGGFVATTPGIYSPSRLRIFTLKAGILYFTQPPSGTNLINPFGRTAWVIKPTASEWASIWITGRLPLFSFLAAYTLSIPSTVISAVFLA